MPSVLFFLFFFFSRRIAPRTVHVLSLPLCNLFVLIPFLQDFFFKIGCLCTFLLDLGPELYFPVVASPLKLQYNESAAHRVKPQSVTVGDIGAVLSAVQNYKNETRAKFVDGHGESRPLLTISGGLLSQVALTFQISESSYYTACTGTAIKHK